VRLPSVPLTPRENVVDDVHGAKITDPYRWLEADATERVRDWSDKQNARTRAVLDPLPQRAAFARRLRELLSVGLLSTPRPIGGRIFHTRREGEQKQAVLDRNFQKMLDTGGNVYFLAKIFASDGLSYVQAVSTMTDMNVEQYQAMMLAGGRNIEGWRSKKERGEA